MDAFTSLCLGLGLGVAAGAAVAASARAGQLRSPFGLLGLVLAVAVAAGVALAREDVVALAALGGLVGAAVAVAALGGLVIAAGSRAGAEAGVAAWIALFEVVVVAATLLFPPAALLPLLALGWLWVARRRREPRKYKGLRSLT